MKKQLSVGLVIAGISLLIISSGLAEPTHPNEVGLYTTPDGYGPTGTFIMGSPVDVYLVLTKPTNMQTGVPYNTIAGFELTLNFNPIGGFFLLAHEFQSLVLNIGDVDHFGDGYLEFIVGTGEDWLIVNEAVVLVTFTYMNVNPSPVEVTLGPTSVPGIPGQMAFVSYDEGQPYHLTAMHPISGSHDAPVFIFNGEAVAVENESFGSVKALYR